MRVKFEFFQLLLPRKRFEIADSVRKSADIFIVKAQAENSVGWGAGTPSKRFSDSLHRCRETLTRSTEASIDLDSYFEENLIYEIREKSIAAAAAIDIAMWDLKGKVDGKSLSALLGGVPRAMETAATVDIQPIDRAVEEAIRLRNAGFKTFKIKVGKSVREDIERTKAIRNELGFETRLLVDANSGYDFQNAIKFWSETSQLKVELFEQPISAEKISLLAKLKKEHGIRICADESVIDESSLEVIIEQEAADLINIKLMKSGGLSAAIKMAEIARNAKIALMIGCMGDIGISISAAAHLATAVNPVYIDLDSHLNIEPVCDGPRVENGKVEISDAAGLGVSLISGWKKWQV